MTNYFNTGYGGFNGYNNPQQFQSYLSQQNNLPVFTVTFVSNIAEAIATKPDVTGKPSFFYNKSEEEIYVKQYDNTGAAPVRTYKLVISANEQETNPLISSIKILDDKLNDIKNLLTPNINNEETDKKGKK